MTTGRFLTVVLLGLAAFARCVTAQPLGPDAYGGIPTAPGSLTQAPEANLLVGGSMASVPIDLPPGPNGMTPSLALVYSSAGGPSLYGHGWDLPIGRIQRRLKHGVLNCANLADKDYFILTLPGKTIEFKLVQDKGVPVVEEHFLKIRLDSGQNIWTAQDTEGHSYTFGGGPWGQPRYPLIGNDISSVFNAVSCTQNADLFGLGYTFSWELTSIEDANGNTIDISYDRGTMDMPRPVKIQYGGASQPLKVEFAWVDRSSKPASSSSGWPTRSYVRLSSIKVKLN
jgi:hypothetical protein